MNVREQSLKNRSPLFTDHTGGRAVFNHLGVVGRGRFSELIHFLSTCRFLLPLESACKRMLENFPFHPGFKLSNRLAHGFPLRFKHDDCIHGSTFFICIIAYFYFPWFLSLCGLARGLAILFSLSKRNCFGLWKFFCLVDVARSGPMEPRFPKTPSRLCGALDIASCPVSLTPAPISPSPPLCLSWG